MAKANRLIDLESLAQKLQENCVIAWFIAKNTLTVVLIALIVLSPLFIWPLLMGWPVPYCYIAYAIWVSYFVGAIILAAFVGYMRETRTE